MAVYHNSPPRELSRGSILPSRTAKGILQPSPRYQTARYPAAPQTPPSSSLPDDSSPTLRLRDNRRGDHRGGVPDVYMETISKCFGSPVDLYRDVLKVSSVADARELRIGYFRRGREVLTDAGLSGLDGLSDASKLPDGAKATFQAVSMAYEILSKPEWKEQYLRDGLRSQPPRDGDQSRNDATTVVVQDPRPTIRWNEQVEELVYEREPHEEAELMEWTNNNKRKRKKPKAKIMMDEEDEELDDHLAKLDAEAKAHFTHDFLDSLEESLDGLLGFTGKRRDKKTNRRDDDDDDDDDDDVCNNVDNDDDDDHDDDEPSVDDNNNDDENSLTDAVPSKSAVKTTSSNDDDSLVGLLTSHLMRLRTGGSKDRTTVDASLVPLSHTEATDPFRCVSPIPSPATSPDDDLFDVAADLASKSDKNIIPDDVFDGIEDENMRQPSSITLPRRRPPSPSNISTVSDLSESVVTARSQSNGAFVLTPGGSAAGDRSSIQASHHSVSKSVAKEIFEEAPEDEFLEDVDDWFQISNAISNVFSFGGKDNTNNNNKGSAVVTPEKVSGQQMSSSQQQDDEGFMGALTAFVQEVARECAAMGQNFAKSTDAVVDACKIDENDVHQLMRILTDEVKQAPPMERKDAVQSPTLFAMEAAKSFS